MSSNDADTIALTAIDGGAEDFKIDGTYIEIYSDVENLDALRNILEKQGMTIISSELSMVPLNTVPLDAKVTDKTLKLLDQFEELDDIQKVYTNADFADEVLEKYKS